MKNINEFLINESLNKESYYVIKIIDGKYKDSYITSGSEYYESTPNINNAYKGKDLNDIKEFKAIFDEETKGNWGKSIILQVDITYKEIK